jgi:uronate dehydrogenase
MSELRRVLITGAAGRLGGLVAAALADRYQLRLTDLAGPDLAGLSASGQVVAADLTDGDAARELCAGMDTVVHLAASPDPSSPWSTLLPANIIATYNVMNGAVLARCRRVVYASSIHAVSGYPPDVQVKTGEPVNPGDLYGVTKCFGEALGRYVAEQEGPSVIAVRIGAVQAAEAMRRQEKAPLLDAFVSEADLTQLIERCIVVEGVRWAVVHGLSDNRFKRLDLSDTRALLGYQPQDDSAALNELVPEPLLDRPLHNASAPEQESGLREGPTFP